MSSTVPRSDTRPMLHIESPTNFIEVLASSDSRIDIDLPDTIILKAGKL